MDPRSLEAMASRAQAMEVDCADNDNEFPTTQRRRRRVVLLRHFLECASTKHLEMWLRRKLNSLDWIQRLATYRSKEVRQEDVHEETHNRLSNLPRLINRMTEVRGSPLVKPTDTNQLMMILMTPLSMMKGAGSILLLKI